MDIPWEQINKYLNQLVLPAVFVTLRIMVTTMIISVFLGFIVGCIMTYTHPHGLKPNKIIYSLISFLVNVIRSFPFIILIVTLAPLTRLLIGTMIGEKAAIFPLSIGGTAIISRLIESALLETSPHLIEAARSFGASNIQILYRVMLKESVPNLINSGTLATINCVGATTMAGAVGAGGLGSVALNYGYHSFNNVVLYTSVVLIFLIVQLIQVVGNVIYKKIVARTGKGDQQV